MAIITTPTVRLNRLMLAACASAMLVSVGFAENSATGLPPSNAVVTISVGQSEPASAAQVASPATASTQPVQWSDIKDYGSEMRDQFLAGLQKLETTINAQLAELSAKRGSVKATSSEAKELDLALNELSNAQFFIKTTRDLVKRASPQTWEQMKAKVGLAWTRSQAAYAKVQTRTTS